MAIKHYVRNSYPTSGDFPDTGENNVLYEAADTGILYRWNAETSLYEPWGAGSSNTLHYIAALSQTGTNAPVATVIRNDFDGEIVWNRINTGSYTATLVGAFTGTIRVIPPSNWDSGVFSEGWTRTTVGVSSTDEIYLLTHQLKDSTGVSELQDNILQGLGYSYIEIIKYL